jgi:glutamyl-tRNA synthetase
MGITHIIRGKEHLTNALRQTFLYKHFGWNYPENMEYGRIRTTDIKLSKSLMVKEVSEGLVNGIDDPRLATLAALRRRGYVPSTFRKIVYEMGPRSVDATLSWENINALNRKEIDKIANRYSFISNPLHLEVSNVPGPIEAKLPLHPSNPEAGMRIFNVEPKEGHVQVLLPGTDIDILQKSKVVRLMELFNVEIESVHDHKAVGKFHSRDYLKAKELKAPLVNWLPANFNIECNIVMPDASNVQGPIEPGVENETVGNIVQLVRFGFGRIDSKESNKYVIYFAHR